MSGFDADWLRQRASYDRAARNPALAASFVSALGHRTTAPLRLLDLAAGTGANFRVLAPQIAQDQDWLLVDNDAALLARLPAEIARWAHDNGGDCAASPDGVLVRAASGALWRVRMVRVDLAQSLETLDATAFDGITTTAFLDLVSAAWLDRFVAWLTPGARPLLATLTVDGRRLWQPALPDDTLIDQAFRRHQDGDKGFGPSLGPDATQALAARLLSAGHQVHTARADWRITNDDPEMLTRMIEESAAVACEAMPDAATGVRHWRMRRLGQRGHGELAMTVGHEDLFARATLRRARHTITSESC